MNERLQHILQGNELQYEEEVAQTDKHEEEEGVAPMHIPAEDKAAYVDLTAEHLEAKEPDFESMNLSTARLSRDNMTERAKYGSPCSVFCYR